MRTHSTLSPGAIFSTSCASCDSAMLADASTGVQSTTTARKFCSVPRVTYAVAASSEQNFRAVVVDCTPVEASASIALSQDAQDVLKIAPGDNVLCVRI